ncbi:MAG TPA: polysaccharide deacetylase family protein [Rhizomicrobium sp.]|jgi:peptidoglycan/xylan/chitin deacetylase (PgdA/CDA1 family)
MSRILRDIAEWCPPALARAFGRPAALFFHGVEREIRDPGIQRNHHDAASFRAIARALKQNFDVLPLSALSDVMKAPERHSRALFLMSDDGYANTLTVAADILEEEGLPWTLFISTHHIDTGEWNPMTLARLCGKSLEKQAAADEARLTLDTMLAEFGQANLFETMERFPSENFLDWEGVRALQARGVEIGAHAHWHWPMNAAQTSDYLREQALVPRARIAAQLGSCRAFAYPFGNTGDVSPEAWQAVRDAGYEYGFTTLSASLDGGANPWLLPRYGLAPREPNLAALVPLLRAGNGRLRHWQSRLAG